VSGAGAPLLNLAGSSFDFGNVLFAVLQECEHRRRALLPGEAEARLREAAREKLEEIRESYRESGGTPAYWQALEREVLETALPQYLPAAVEQTRLEKTRYDLWRQGDTLARVTFALIGLVLGGLIVAAPFIPIWEDAFAFVLAVMGLLYPEVKQLAGDLRHSRLLNRLIGHAEKYQKDERLHYLSTSRLEEELQSMGTVEKQEEPEASPAPHGRGRSRQRH
jgi:hypothetical protein